MSWTRVCALEDVPENSVKPFTANGISLVVANYGGKYRAIPPMCPHMEEPLAQSAVIADCVMTCTKHLWAWNLASLDMQGETEKPLKCYDTKEEDGALHAKLDAELLYDFEEEGGDEDDEAFFSQ